MKHKFLKAIIFFMFSVLICAFIGCKDDGNNNSDGIYDMPPSSSEQKLTLDKSECYMIVGDELELFAQYTPQENATLTWASSDAAVVTVTNGKLLAQMAGESTITATYGELKATCKVNVTFGNIYPTIDFENGMEESLTTNTVEKVNFGAKTKFNGKVFSDGEFSYTVSEVTDEESSKNLAIVKAALETSLSNKAYVEVNKDEVSGKFIRLPERNELTKEIDESQIVEFYNRKL